MFDHKRGTGTLIFLGLFILNVKCLPDEIGKS